MQNKESPKLRECPFCGGTPMLETFVDMFNRIKYGVECHFADCEISPYTAWYADKNDAIEAWNRRTHDST